VLRRKRDHLMVRALEVHMMVCAPGGDASLPWRHRETECGLKRNSNVEGVKEEEKMGGSR
jgi:hypothetical protein